MDGVIYTTSASSKVQAFDANGIMCNGGMVGFKDDFPPTEIEAIRAFMIDRAQARGSDLRKFGLKKAQAQTAQ